MILTNKAKEDFLSWYGTGENYFNTTISEIEQNANIIEWFDEVEIYISILPYYMQHEKYNIGFEPTIFWYGLEETLYNDNDVFETRQDATVEAIKRANNIYNSRFKQ